MERPTAPAYRPTVIYQHPLAYLVGIEGLALLRSWSDDVDEEFVRARLAEVRDLLADEMLRSHPGVRIEEGAASDAYRQWAPAYDDPTNDLLHLDLPAIDAILDGLPSGTAVDAACGTGRLARRLIGRGHRVLGIDASLDMLHQARRNVPGVPFALGDLHGLPLADGSVDLVTNALALTHVADLAGVFTEFARVLRPGGVAIVSDVHPDLAFLGSTVKAEGPSGEPRLVPCHGRSVADYLRAALSAGFRVRGYSEHTPPDQRPRADKAPATPAAPEIGPWRAWPWSLLAWAPEAARAAWDVPSLFVWHLELDEPARPGR
jgi:ubiquinone/menaquinone biosynthesis C-methylase UbiE